MKMTPAVAYSPQLLPIGQQERADGHHCQAGREAVHTVGTVDHIDAGPDEHDDEQQVDRVRDAERPVQQLHAGAVEVEVGDTCHHRDDKINEALFVFVPGRIRRIVKIAREHGGDEEDGHTSGTPPGTG